MNKKELTKEQWFWEQCGFKQLEPGRGGYHYRTTKKVWNWLPPSETERHKSIPFLPPIDLNNLFLYAVPKIREKLKTKFRFNEMVVEPWVKDWLYWDEDPADSLFEIIYKAFGGKE